MGYTKNWRLVNGFRSLANLRYLKLTLATKDNTRTKINFEAIDIDYGKTTKPILYCIY